MSKKYIILIAIVLLFLALFFGFSYLTKDNSSINQENTTEGNNFFTDIFNFGNNNGINKTNPLDSLVDFITGNDSVNENENKTKKANKISSVSIAGYGIYQKEIYTEFPDVEPAEIKQATIEETPTTPNTEFVSVLKYVNNENGNVYQTFVKDLEEKTYSTTTIPNVYESFFTNKNIIYRYLKNQNTIVTFLGELPKEILGQDSSSNEIFGTFLPDEIKDISVSVNNESLFYLSPTKSGVVGVLFNNGNKNNIFSSSFSEWSSHWPNNDFVILNTKPSGLVDGFAFILNTKNRDFSKIIGNIKGLTTLGNYNLDTVLFADNNLNLKLLDVSTNDTKNLKLRTHSEKCIWSNDNITLYCAIPKEIPAGFIYPDAWYQGEVSYEDQIYRINTQTGARTVISDLIVDSGEIIDAINLKLDKDEKTLFFMNKVDSYLWGLNLN